MRAYANSPLADLVAVCGRAQERTDRVARHFGVSGYLAVEEVIARERPDLVSVSTSDDAHYETTRQLLEAGIPVLVEKPLTVDLAQGLELVALTRRSGGRCGVNFGMRYLMPFQLMRTAIDEGRIGPPLSVFWKFSHQWPLLVGGTYAGMILSMQIHGLNMVRAMAGPVASVHAMGVSAPGVEVPTTTVALLRFESGAGGVVMGGTDGPISSDIMTLQIQGTLGRATVSDGVREFELNVRSEPANRVWRPFLFDVAENDFQRATDWHIEEFVRAMLTDDPEPIPIEEGYEALRLAFAIIESATNERTVHVAEIGSPPERAPTYAAPLHRRRPTAGIEDTGYADETIARRAE
jgi:predicted dehydrogenase